jgi:hypothetical protein
VALSDPVVALRGCAARAALADWSRVRANGPLLHAVLPALAEDSRAAPDDDLRWFRLGAAREIARDVAGAVEAYERQVALDPFAARVRERLTALRAARSDPRAGGASAPR